MNAENFEPPATFDECREIIRQQFASLPRRLAQVAEFVMANPDDFALGTASSVAEHAGVQPSTVVRFARTFGFSGFTEMQTIFQTRMRGRSSTYNERLLAIRDADGSIPDTFALLDGIAHSFEESIRNLRTAIDTDKLEQAVRLLEEADTIYLVGLRRSAILIDYMAYLCCKMGIRNVVVGSSNDMEAEIAQFARPTDATILVSYSPYAPKAVELFHLFRRQNVRQIVITDSPFSPVVPNGGVWFELAETDFNGFRANSAAMVLLTTLATATAERRGDVISA